MVKDTRYIIKKVIIGVLIALILMFLKTNVFAEELDPYYTNPNSVGITNSDGGTSYPTFLSFNVVGGTTPFYGTQSISAGTNIREVFWYVPKASSKDVNLQFVLYQYGLWSASYEPFSVWAVDTQTNAIFTCDINSSRYVNNTALYTGSNYFNSIYCPHVKAKGDLRIYLAGSPFQAGLTNTVVGLSKTTWVVNSSNSEIVNAIEDGTNATKEQTDTIKDSSVDNDKASSDIDTMNGKVASNGTITELITLPIRLYQAILNNVDGACSPINLGSLYNHNLRLTCINLSNLLGSTLYNIIDVLCCGLFILAFRKKMVDIFNHMTSLNDRGNELE